MKSNPYYKQCILRRFNVVEFAWIPRQFASGGKHVDILDRNSGEWSTWQVDKVYSTVLSHEELQAKSQQYKDTRKTSDI